MSNFTRRNHQETIRPLVDNINAAIKSFASSNFRKWDYEYEQGRGYTILKGGEKFAERLHPVQPR